MDTRGGSYLNQEDPDAPELYTPIPSNPVKQSKVKCKKDSVSSAYDGEDLDYYLDNYLNYWVHVNTEEFHDMKADLEGKDSAKVCYNVEVKDNNGTAMGAFSCPLSFEHRDLKKCCGHSCAQFCCSAEYYSESEKDWGAAAFALILLGGVAVGCVFYFYLGSKI